MPDRLMDSSPQTQNLSGQINDGALISVEVAGETLAREVLYCRSAGLRRHGVLAWGQLTREQGALLVMPAKRLGKVGWMTSIHMLGVGFPLAVAWLDERGQIVWPCLARPWRPYYASPRPASFVLELHPDHLPKLNAGELVSWSTTRESRTS